MLYPNLLCRILRYDVVFKHTMLYPGLRCRILTGDVRMLYTDIQCRIILAYCILYSIWYGMRYSIWCLTHGCVVRWHLPLQKGPGLQYLHGLFKSKDYAAEDDSFSCEEGDIVGQAAQLSPRLALARWYLPLLLCPRPKTCVVAMKTTVCSMLTQC
jgi:hypothetical protein